MSLSAILASCDNTILHYWMVSHSNKAVFVNITAQLFLIAIEAFVLIRHQIVRTLSYAEVKLNWNKNFESWWEIPYKSSQSKNFILFLCLITSSCMLSWTLVYFHQLNTSLTVSCCWFVCPRIDVITFKGIGEFSSLLSCWLSVLFNLT